MHYTLHQLKVFLKIVETKSITQAANLLHLSQPALSIQLKNFQDQFDIPLTEVVGRKLFITPFGFDIAESAISILNEVENMNTKIQQRKKNLVGPLKITSVSTGKYVIPYYISDFVNQHQGVDLILDVTNKTKVITSLEKNEVDFALVSVLTPSLNLNQLPLLPNKLFWVGKSISKNLSLSNLKKILATTPIIFREQGSATRQAMEKYLADHKIIPSKKLVLTSNEAVKQAILAGLGISLMPIIGLKNAIEGKEVDVIQIKDFPIITNWSLVWQQSKNLSPVALAFIDYLNAQKEQITSKYFDWCNSY